MINSLRSWCMQTLSASVLAGVMFSPLAQADWKIDGTLIIPPVCQLGQQDPIRVSLVRSGCARWMVLPLNKISPTSLSA